MFEIYVFLFKMIRKTKGLFLEIQNLTLLIQSGTNGKTTTANQTNDILVDLF